MIRRIKHLLIPLYQRFATLRGGRTFVRSDGNPRAYVLLAPDYGNVGDLAIGVAEAQYLERTLPGYEIVAVPLAETYASLRSIRSGFRDGDLAFLVGGGNTGDLYPRAHFGRIFAIRYLRRFPMISFPQSIIYSSEHAKKIFGRREGAAFRSHPRLRLFVRERTSMKIMREIFRGSVGFSPDIVLSMQGLAGEEARRMNTLLVLRGDGERSLSAADHGEILTAAESVGGPIITQDHEVEFDPRQDITPAVGVEGMMDQYRDAKIVITDRLHGMIFAAVTGTPCVVLPNANHKITGTYQDWLRESCPFIRLADARDADSLERLIRQVIEVAESDARPPALAFEELDAAVAEFAVVPTSR